MSAQDKPTAEQLIEAGPALNLEEEQEQTALEALMKYAREMDSQTNEKEGDIPHLKELQCKLVDILAILQRELKEKQTQSKKLNDQIDEVAKDLEATPDEREDLFFITGLEEIRYTIDYLEGINGDLGARGHIEVKGVILEVSEMIERNRHMLAEATPACEAAIKLTPPENQEQQVVATESLLKQQPTTQNSDSGNQLAGPRA